MSKTKNTEGISPIELYLRSLSVSQLREMVQHHMIKKSKTLKRNALYKYIQENGLIPKQLQVSSSKPDAGFLEYERNSCYLDSFLTCFVLAKPSWFKVHVCEASLAHHTDELLKAAAVQIQKELCEVYKSLVVTKTTYKCRALRKYFRVFDDLYKPGHPEEWTSTQTDPNAVVEILNRVFKFPETIEIDGMGSREYSGITVYPSQDRGEALHLKSVLPITRDWIADQKRYHMVHYLKADFLYVNVLRNLDDLHKNDSPVIPETRLEFTENTKPLQLKSVIIHDGITPHSGHYNAILRLKGRWYYYDDMTVGRYKYLGRDFKKLFNESLSRNCVGFFYA